MQATTTNGVHAGKPTHEWCVKAEPEKLNTTLSSQKIIKKDRASHESKWRLQGTHPEVEYRYPDAAGLSRYIKVKDHEIAENNTLAL